MNRVIKFIEMSFALRQGFREACKENNPEIIKKLIRDMRIENYPFPAQITDNEINEVIEHFKLE